MYGKRLGKPRKQQTHAGAASSKIEIRRKVLACISNPGVFDAFAGRGDMYRHVWRDANLYVGCDLDWYRDERTMFVADNRRVMRAIDLRAFNVFDIDSYGAPWEQALILAARRKVGRGERIGVILTEGSAIKLRFGKIPTSLAVMAGVKGAPAHAINRYDELIDRALIRLASAMDAVIVHRWQASQKFGSLCRYIGVVLEGNGRVDRGALSD